MPLDITPLDKVIARLEEALSAYFAHKMLKRFMEQTSPSPEEFDTLSFADLIRSGNERGLLLGDWPRWRAWRSMRAKTSHTYDENVALEVVAGIPGFLDEARHLRDQLRSRIAS